VKERERVKREGSVAEREGRGPHTPTRIRKQLLCKPRSGAMRAGHGGRATEIDNRREREEGERRERGREGKGGGARGGVHLAR
jgi:hypothetical protein